MVVEVQVVDGERVEPEGSVSPPAADDAARRLLVGGAAGTAVRARARAPGKSPSAGNTKVPTAFGIASRGLMEHLVHEMFPVLLRAAAQMP